MSITDFPYRDVYDRLGYPGDVCVLIDVKVRLWLFYFTRCIEEFPEKNNLHKKPQGHSIIENDEK